MTEKIQKNLKRNLTW